jgi:hypothetical protein
LIIFTQLIRNFARQLSDLLSITALAVGLLGPVVASDTIAEPEVLGPQFLDLIVRDQLIQSNNSEKTAIVWEVDGDAYCSHTPPEGIENAFQFGDSSRWSTSSTTPGPLTQGDPMVLTYGFMLDGTQGNGFSCFVPGEIAGAASDLIAFLDRIHGAGPGGADLTLRPWFSIFESAFDNWGVLNGIQYVYEPNDDGAGAGNGGAPGLVGVRADLRIGGHFIDGQIGSNVLACNYFPNNGDMIIDTGNTVFYAPNPPEQRGFRNVLEHEHGHGMGISHVCPINQSKLMEPFISTAYLGAQEDDILAANRGYGDRDESPIQNDTSVTATPLGAIAISETVTRTQVSVDNTGDQDFYSFEAPVDAQASITVTPRGSTYLNGSQNANGSCSAGSSFNALTQSKLGFELRGQSGINVIASANSLAAGVAEQTSNTPLNEGAGTYFVRIFGAQAKAQMYDLTVQLTQNQPQPQSDDLCLSLKMGNDKVATFCL